MSVALMKAHASGGRDALRKVTGTESADVKALVKKTGNAVWKGL